MSLNRPENSLIKALSRLTIPPAEVPSLEPLLRSLPSADRFFDCCREQGLAPLVYQHLKTHRLDTVIPESTVQKFRTAYLRTLTFNLQYMELLGEIDRISPIPIMVLKGPALIHLVYTDPGIRPMSDLDLMVSPEDLPEFQQILSNLGFRDVPHYPDVFQREKLVLDIHTDPLNQSRIAARGWATPIKTEQLWASAQPFKPYRQLKILDITDQILTLAIHALKHGYQQQIWLLDLLECLQHIDCPSAWDRLLNRSETFQASRILSITFFVMQTRLGCRLPDPALNLQKSFPLGQFERKIILAAAIPGPFQILEPLVLFKTLQNPQEKLRYLLEIIFPQRVVLSQITGIKNRKVFWLS
ncbi:MAG: nucleotidyltransferase family protein, partial [bacterium]|nr:nucleotidyltransferase family protein [bacterium]